MSGHSGTVTGFPTVKEFCLDVPLYTSYTKSNEFDDEQSYYDHIQRRYEYFSENIDCFCMKCNQESIFINARNLSEEPRSLFGKVEYSGRSVYKVTRTSYTDYDTTPY